MLEISVFDFRGHIDVLSSDLDASNTAEFSLSHDDGGSLTIAGTSIISTDCCGTDSALVTFNHGAGFYAIDVIFSNVEFNGGVGGANINLLINGNVVPASQLFSTPEPGSVATLVGLCGMGLIGLVVRRRRRSA